MAFRRLVLLLLLLPSRLLSEQVFNEVKYRQVVEKLESDAIEFAREVELAHLFRCDERTLGDCFQNNYDDCLSVHDNQVCPVGANFAIPTCGTECSGLWDFTASSVSVPGHNRNPSDAA